jgi:SAM-dependent methyltransferase
MSEEKPVGSAAPPPPGTIHPEGPGHPESPIHPESAGQRNEAWDFVAEGYQAYWCPRFRPYWEEALDEFQPPPLGPLAVPGCGPGEEVLLLLKRHPDRSIVATDPSQVMIRLVWGRLRASGASSVLANVGAAESLSDFVRQAAGVFSSFSLQLVECPIAALKDWSLALRAGGSIAVLFWPKPLPGTVADRLQAALTSVSGEARPDWEGRALECLSQLGLRLVGDEMLLHEMEHQSPEEYFDRLVASGPLQLFLRRFGRMAVEESRRLWLRDHGLERKGDRWVHRPPARLWVMERLAARGLRLEASG